MFKNDLVVSVKANNKFLREMGQNVRIPFGTEYEIYLKNTRDCDCIVDVTIDGKEVSDKLVYIKANSQFELKGDTRTNHAFRFIERTKKISKHRGNKADDGLIRVEYYFRKHEFQHPKVVVSSYKSYVTKPYSPFGPLIGQAEPYRCDSTGKHPMWGGTIGAINANYVQSDLSITTNSAVGQVSYTAGGDDMVFNCMIDENNQLNSHMLRSVEPKNETGITVGGSDVQQGFTEIETKEWEWETDRYSMTLQLLGEVEGEPVKKVVESRKNIVCSICGTSNKSSQRFCGDCGNRIQQ